MKTVDLMFFFVYFSQADHETEELETRLKEQNETIVQLTEEITKVKAATYKETKLVDQQNQQSERLNDEIRSVTNLIAFEEAKLAKGQIDEYVKSKTNNCYVCFFFQRRQSTEAVKSTVQMCRQVREQHQKFQKQKERLLRELKRAENQHRHAEDELASANMTVERLKLRVNCAFREKNNLYRLNTLARSTADR